jgi:hypothetical protein
MFLLTRSLDAVRTVNNITEKKADNALQGLGRRVCSRLAILILCGMMLEAEILCIVNVVILRSFHHRLSVWHTFKLNIEFLSRHCERLPVEQPEFLCTETYHCNTTSPVTIETGLPGDFLATWQLPGDFPDFTSFAYDKGRE